MPNAQAPVGAGDKALMLAAELYGEAADIVAMLLDCWVVWVECVPYPP